MNCRHTNNGALPAAWLRQGGAETGNGLLCFEKKENRPAKEERGMVCRLHNARYAGGVG